METLNITKQGLEHVHKECDLKEEVIEDLEEANRSQYKSRNGLKSQGNSLKIAFKNDEPFTCENKTLISEISDLNLVLKLANKEAEISKPFIVFLSFYAHFSAHIY